jgi:hypothetical protein
MNCDGVINLGDINPFSQALAFPVQWTMTYPGCQIQNGDINGDGTTDMRDINPFSNWLSQHMGEPCPL